MKYKSVKDIPQIEEILDALKTMSKRAAANELGIAESTLRGRVKAYDKLVHGKKVEIANDILAGEPGDVIEEKLAGIGVAVEHQNPLQPKAITTNVPEPKQVSPEKTYRIPKVSKYEDLLIATTNKLISYGIPARRLYV